MEELENDTKNTKEQKKRKRRDEKTNSIRFSKSKIIYFLWIQSKWLKLPGVVLLKVYIMA